LFFKKEVSTHVFSAGGFNIKRTGKNSQKYVHAKSKDGQKQTWLSVSPFIHQHLNVVQSIWVFCWDCPFIPLIAVV